MIVQDDVISLNDATSLACDLACSFPDMGDYLLNDFLSLLTYMSGPEQELSLKELVSAVDTLRSALAEGDPSILTQPRGLRVRRIVDVQEFVESKFYMGQKGYVRPKVMEKLWELFHGEGSEDRLEAVLGGGIGWGKSFMAEMGLGYMLYKLSCFHSPQLEYGLAPGSSMYFIVQSVNEKLAKKVLFNQLGQRLRRSEYFSKHFQFDKNVLSELRFPNDITILPLASADTSALGLNVFGGILDELNFMARVIRPASSRFTGEQEYDQAETLYATVVRRMKSRFNVRGRVPGKLFLISSANYPGDFIERKIKESEDEIARTGRSNVFVVRMSQWQSLPEDRLSPERFYVEVGDATRSSRILESLEEAVDLEAVIEVPMDYYHDFVTDLEAALRDFAGIPIGGVGAFIRRRESIERGAAIHDSLYEQKQLFSRSAVDLSLFADSLGSLLNEEYFEFLQNPAGFYVHVDLALSGDSGGLGIGHCGGFKTVGKSMNWDEETGKYIETAEGRQPIIVIDGILEIIPPKVDEIDINLIGDFLGFINSRLKLETVTADSYQSAALLQRMRKLRNLSGRRIRSGVLSVDANVAPYFEVKQALRDERLFYPNVDKLKKEFRELVLDPKSKKIDHPSGGSKDLADTVAGVTYIGSLRNAVKGVTGSLGRALLAGIDAEEESENTRPRGSGRRLY
jgi:hypothetical protein